MSKQADKSSKSGGQYTPTIINKKARFNYHLLEKLEAGISLVGTEVKSLREGKAALDESFCRIRNDELYLVGCTIALYKQGNLLNHEPLRERKLLVHRRELKKIAAKIAQKGLTVVPLRIYFKSGRAKVEIAIAQGKAQSDKREKIKGRDADREIRRAMNRRRRQGR